MALTDPSRALAVRLIAAVTDRGQMLDEGPDSADPATRARARRLADATLRQLQRADAVLAPHLKRPPEGQLLALLRLCVVEMLALGAPPHGVVSEGVSLARKIGGEGQARLANAVLRRAASFEGWDALPQPRLPGWLGRKLAAHWGKPVVAAIEAAHLAGAPLDLTLRPMAPRARAELIAALNEAAGPVAEIGAQSLRLGRMAQVSALPGFSDGAWWVQDVAAALPATLIGAGPGMRVLDLCAAPGGKTLQLAATGADVTALDSSAARLERLSTNLRRTGLTAEVICADALHWAPERPFDAILLDAPCSATGTIRRHADLPLIRKPADIASLVALQAALLDRAAGWLATGGVLVYATCSLLAEEGEEQITALATRGALRADPLPPPPFGHQSPEGGWRIRPDDLADQGGADGFFMARLRASDG
jgi:16S rRNA (cytosine967-C5)-methyltransferase